MRRFEKKKKDIITVSGVTAEGKRVLIINNEKVIILDKEDIIDKPKVDESKKEDKISKFNLLKKIRKKNVTPDKLEIFILGTKVNENYTKWIDGQKDNDFKLDSVEYKVKKDSLLKMKLTLLEKFKDKLRIQKIRKKFAIYFDNSVVEPKVIDFKETMLSSKMCFKVIHAKIPGMGPASMFKGEGWQLPKIGKIMLYIGIVAAVVILLVGYTQGWFNELGKLIKW